MIKINYQIGFFFEPIIVIHYISEKNINFNIQNQKCPKNNNCKFIEIRNKNFSRNSKNNICFG